MERIYRCTSCGLRSRVLAADTGADEAIHCPRCGGRAVYRQGWSDAPGGPVVQVDLTARKMPDSEESPELGGAMAQPDGAPREVVDNGAPRAFRGDPSADRGEEARDTRPVTFDSERRSLKTETTPVGLPSTSLSPTPSSPVRPLIEAVTTIPNVDVGPLTESDRSHPILPGGKSSAVEEELERTTRRFEALDLRAASRRETVDGLPPAAPPRVAAPPPPSPAGVPWPGASQASDPPPPGSGWAPAPEVTSASAPPAGAAPYLEQSQEDIARGGRGMAGKAWSASGIRRALAAEGLTTDEHAPLPRATPTRGLDAWPPKPSAPVESPDLGALAGSDTAGERGGVAAATAPGDGPTDETPRPPREPLEVRVPAQPNADDPYHSATPVPVRPTRRRAAGSRVLIFLTVCVAVLAIGVVVGVVWYDQSRSAPDESGPAYEVMSDSQETRALALRRAEMLALPPLAERSPIELGWRRGALDYPRRLEIEVRLTNRSASAIAALHLTATWYLIHDAPVVAQPAGIELEPRATVGAPLLPGESTAAQIRIDVADLPPGPARESFVWLELTAANTDLDIFFDGGAAMIEIPATPAP